MKYKRILVKLSGEALMGSRQYGIDSARLKEYATEIKEVVKQGVEVAIVIGGGNIFRGVAGASNGMDRVQGDYMGMLATVINSLALQSALEDEGIFTRLQTAIKLEAIAEAKERIHALSEEIYQSFAFYLNKETANILSYITGERYDSLFIDQNLRSFVNTKEKMLPLEQASTGTIDQLYLSLRLAMAKLLQKERKEYLPLLFDDSFAMYDENRLAAALSFVNKAYPAQILLFTCHKREAEVLQQLDIPFHMRSL